MKSKISAETAGMSDEIRPIEPEDASGQIKELVDVTDEAPNSPNLDSSTGTAFQPPPDPGLSALEELLKASGETDLPTFMPNLEVSRPVPSPGMIAIPTPEEVAAIENGDRLESTRRLDEHFAQSETFQKIFSPEHVEATNQAIDRIASIGPQPNGDYGVVVIVPEQMVSLVLGQAEMDGVSPTEWLTVRLGEYLESWTFGR